MPRVLQEESEVVCAVATTSTQQSEVQVFEECQASHDPNNIVQLLQQTPYHTDALLVMFNLYRVSFPTRRNPS